MTDKKKIILEAVEKLTDTYRKEELFLGKDRERLPNKKEIINFIKDMRSIIFPGYFSVDSSASVFPEHYVAYRLNDLYDCLQEQIEIAFLYQGEEEQKAKEHAEQITERFFANVPEIQRMLLTDLQAGFDGDPAAKSKEEIIFSYPGFYAIYVYRLAHVLYLENVPFIPRIMSEYAHGYTGIDINPGATIGEYFFIDHGTGVVIGETTEIGKNVKLYQGVTLGALSTRQGQLLANVKRHPTIRDNVTIYSNSSVLGGETVIGENTIIGGNTFITASIPANTKVSAKSPELVIKKPNQKQYIGKLSAFCGAVSASCAAGAGITYMGGGELSVIKKTIENTLANIPGIICDGAKISCAAKIAASLDAAFLAHHLAMNGQSYAPYTGILKEEAGETISCVGQIGKEGMKETDKEILRIMLERV